MFIEGEDVDLKCSFQAKECERYGALASVLAHGK